MGKYAALLDEDGDGKGDVDEGLEGGKAGGGGLVLEEDYDDEDDEGDEG